MIPKFVAWIKYQGNIVSPDNPLTFHFLSKYQNPSDIDLASEDRRLPSVMIGALDLSNARVKIILPSEIKLKITNGYIRKYFVDDELLLSHNSITSNSRQQIV